MDADCWQPGAQAGTLFLFASNFVDYMFQVPDFASVFYYLHNCSNLPRPLHISNYRPHITATSHSAEPVSLPDGNCVGLDGRRKDAL